MSQVEIGRYRDVPDFIHGITREIWEDRGTGGKLEHLYPPGATPRVAISEPGY